MSGAPDALEQLPSGELHRLALRRAVERRDVRFLWKLLQMLPAAEAVAGELDEAEADVLTLRGHIDDLADAGRPRSRTRCARSISITCATRAIDARTDRPTWLRTRTRPNGESRRPGRRDR